MTNPSRREVVEQITTQAGRDYAETQAAQSRPSPEEPNPQMRAFLNQLLQGSLPDPGDIPDQDPQVLAIAKELSVIHMPEWRNSAGRKLAEPAVAEIKGAIRIAEYLVRRGMRLHAEEEKIRWIPTPGGPPGAYDLGLHVTPDENGRWPDPDPEEFWDISDIDVRRASDGSWVAVHPRGLEFTAKSKSEAYAGLVERLRAKIVEARSAS